MRVLKVIGLIATVLILAVPAAGCTDAVATPPTTATQVPYQQTAEEFIRNSSTFRFDGIPGSIKFTNIVGSAEGSSPAADWEFTIEFQTGHPGHGDRSGQMLVQVVTTMGSYLTMVRDIQCTRKCLRHYLSTTLILPTLYHLS